MKTHFRIVILLFVVALLSIGATAQYSRKPYASGELLVKFADSNGNNDNFASRTGSKIAERLHGSEWTRIILPKGMSVEEAQQSLSADPAVQSAQPNFYYYLNVTPNDTRFGELYGMTKISAPAAWDLATGSANTVVAIIDTGIQYGHADLAANIWTNPGEIAGNGQDDDGNGFIDDIHGYDFRFNDADPQDEHGHGTHVAGTVGAVGNNALGVVGVNWNVRMMAIKIYDATGLGTTSVMLINAYNYVKLMRDRGVNIRVTNNSYGGCDEACGFDQATKDALDGMGNAGILNVFSAGNDNRDNEITPSFPANYTSPWVMSVASSTSTDARSGFSNWGVTSVDLAAPGSSILSTVFNGTGYGFKSGTSMASPHVAGSAALLSSHNPALSNVSIKATLMNTVDPLAAWNGLVKTGGRLNVAAALSNQTQCNIVLNPTSQSIPAAGGNFQLSVTDPVNCDYEISTDASFVTITSPGPGSGNETVTYSAAANTSFPRSGKIYIGDKELQVTQAPGQIFQFRVFMDFEGDGRTDYTAIQNVNGQMLWHKLGSAGYTVANFGLFNDDIPVPGFYDNDLKYDIGIWRRTTGIFYYLHSADNTFHARQFGLNGDNPRITQDFDGDGKADVGVTRPVNGKLIWYVLRTSDDQVSIFQFGNEGDIPIRGDYDGDGKADPAVYRPSSGAPANTFFILRSSDGNLAAAQFGTSATDELVPNDYDGDGKTDIAVWRRTTGVWHILKSSNGAYEAFQFGANGDFPVPGDYDGDGRMDYSVWRPGATQSANGVFYVYGSTSGFGSIEWGNATMLLPSNVLRTK